MDYSILEKKEKEKRKNKKNLFKKYNLHGYVFECVYELFK